MARQRKTKKATKQNTKKVFDTGLPQNIFPVGEISGDESKRIYIHQLVYQTIHRFAKNKTSVETGGVLVGTVIEEFGKTNIIIQGFVEAKYTEGTPTTLKFTHETWEHIHKEIEKRFEQGQIVGWIHTHPNFGIFLSEYDLFIQENFFKEENQIAYVVDPIQNIEGFYYWLNGKIERCKGFYVFDRPDKAIKPLESLDLADNQISSEGYAAGGSQASKYIVYILLIALIAALALISTNLFNRLNILESQQETLVSSANQAISTLNTNMIILEDKLDEKTVQIESLTTDVDQLKQKVELYHPTPEEEASQPESEDASAESEESAENTEDNRNDAGPDGQKEPESASEDVAADETTAPEITPEEEHTESSIKQLMSFAEKEGKAD